MALPATLLSPRPSTFLIFKGHRCQLRSGLAICVRNHPTSRTYSARIPTIAQFRELPKVMTHINNIREKLWDIIPRSVKDFPLKKPEDILLRQLLLVGKEALKWSLLALYVFSSVSDVIYCISKNKELMIPFGLFVGYGVTNFLMETSQELFPTTEERGLSRHLLGIGCFFALTKIISASFAVPGQIFLLNVANGGLMQVLWLWKSSTEKQHGEHDTSMPEDAPTL
ncbi:Glycine--tRNA ligase beta subunit like [Actinidia chinensis var. chinensis]|uniref:Glycine--tRNA ligase beta subunit like n=1 Tax=Actinidia chinensis var. chinensis TaxID=1590841 RepID=A0A2R6RNE4_ACTCC|nr:Glycine--tRNA ligase beta subunit like [Actinidia chinensis var. chinensis]